VSYTVRYTRGAREDLLRLYRYLASQDVLAARRARTAIAKGMEFLQEFPFSCRKVERGSPFQREMIIPFGGSGYVALFEVEEDMMVTVLAIRHQREDDYI
jgi:plasmid stabilization system protein ParE